MENPMGVPQPKTAFRHPRQTFTWFCESWNIAKLLTDIDSGALRPKSDTVDRAFIEQFGTEVLALKKGQPEAGANGFLMRVDVKKALALPSEALEEPLIFLNLGKNKGLLRLDGQASAESVLGDGSHRLTKAFFEDVQQLNCYVLSLGQSKRYRI